MKLYAYRSRYEIHEYELGDIPRLERDMSVWEPNIYQPKTGHYEPKYHYDDKNKVLYIPRGYNLKKIEGLVGKTAVFKNDCNCKEKISYSILTPPKTDSQKTGVRYLAGLEDYKWTKEHSQLILNLPTGEGKTYCTIAACSLLGLKTIIIVGTDDLRRQWNAKILEYTNLTQSGVYMINGEKSINKLYKSTGRALSNYAFYITTHSSIRTYMKNNGAHCLNELFDKLGIGVKVIDEAHLQYENTFLIDCAVNAYKNFYLTATFSQSDKSTDNMFQKAYYDIYKLTLAPTVRKHVIWILAEYSSHANAIERAMVRGNRGLQKYKYISYQMSKPYLANVFKHIMQLLIGRLRLEGKILVLSPKKESCEYFKDLLHEIYPLYKSCVHYTGSKVDTFEPYGAIFATVSMLGTGNDISDIRAIVNMEPVSSKRNIIQVVGRLRMFAEDKDTYYIEPIDRSIPQVVRMASKRESVLSGIVKEQMKTKM